VCGRFALYEPTDNLARIFNIDKITISNPKPRYNISPGTDITAVANGTGRSLTEYHWGFVPSWAKEFVKKPINARLETIASSGMFKNAFVKRRILIPANGFYEWAIMGDKKVPYFICQDNHEILAFGGIWEENKTFNKKTAAIITCESNKYLEGIHKRMPFVVQKKDWDNWLNPGTLDDFGEIIVRAESTKWQIKQISNLVNNPRNDTPEILKSL
jgi:putative SOS response-associated peptidase YedK